MTDIPKEIQFTSQLIAVIEVQEERIIELEAALKDIYNRCNCLNQETYDEIEKIINKK